MRLGPKAANLATLKKKYKGFTQFSNKDWFSDFAFMVNLFSHIKELNTKQWGRVLLLMKCTLYLRHKG